MKKLLLLIFSTTFVSWLVFKIATEWPDNNAHVIFCDVGQGDATLIIHGFMQVLIDGGPNARVLDCLEDNLPFWDRNIEFLIITHADLDHIKGILDVLARFSVNYILINPSTKETAVFEDLKGSISSEVKNNKQTSVMGTFPGQRFKLSELVDFVVVSPQVDFSGAWGSQKDFSETMLSDITPYYDKIITAKISENDLSIGTFLTIGNVEVLLPGDLEGQGELAVIGAGLTKPVNILKAGHHGSKSSSTRPFVRVFAPEVSVISSGLNNRFNHPSPQVIELFDEFGVSILRTDTVGTIKFSSDGLSYWQSH
jgi:competence protein ComEC